MSAPRRSPALVLLLLVVWPWSSSRGFHASHGPGALAFPEVQRQMAEDGHQQALMAQSQPGDQAQDASSSSDGQGPSQLRLGFMMPFPVGDSAIPPRVADEWLSAAKMTLSLLAPAYKDFFTVEYYVTNSNCSKDSAQNAAMDLVADDVHAVVGPACSESVIGADVVLRVYNIPYITFAATADIFSSARYPTFFRTVFADTYQAQAIAAVAKQYHLTSLYIFYTNETYGTGLAAALKGALSSVSLVSIPVPYPPPTSQEAYQSLFQGVDIQNATTGVILATTPLVAKNLLLTASGVYKIAYPWWYLGTDGTSTFDLVGTGQQMANLASGLQGEISVGPYDGVDDSGSPEQGFSQFHNFWTQQSYTLYPGLLTLPSSPRLIRPRSYVVNLIDAIWTFHEAAKILLSSGHTLSKATILSCLKGMEPCSSTPVSFHGASGWVAFNVTSGDRLALDTSGAHPQPQLYKVQNFVGLTWKYLGLWKYGNGLDLSGGRVLEVTRPGPIPPNTPVLANITQAQPYDAPENLLADGSTQVDILNPNTNPNSSGENSANNGNANSGGTLTAGTIAAFVVLSVLLAITTSAAIIFYIRGQKRKDAFTRIM